MGSIPFKIKFAVLGAIIVPCFGRLALHGSGSEHDFYRYLVPFCIGGAAGFFIGLMKDRWLTINENLKKTNKNLKKEIQAHKQSKTDLQKSEERFRTIIESTEAGYFFVDKQGWFQDVNDAWMRMHRYSSKDEIIGQHFSLTQPETERTAARKNVELLLNGTPIPSGEFSRQCKDGFIGHHTFSAIPVIKGNEIVGLEGFIVDITDRKKIETQTNKIRKLESMGTLAGGIAHEFNNILGIILGNAELALDTIEAGNASKEHLEEIQSASLRARNVVKHILSFARKSSATLKPIQIKAAVMESMRLIRPTIPAAIEIRQRIDGASEKIYGDSAEIHQVLMNLSNNSVQAMGNGPGILEVALETIDLDEKSATDYEDLAPGCFAKLSMKDTGSGIKAELIDRVLDPYFTTKEVNEGLGMGLAVVYGIIKKCDSAVNIKSKYGEGTVVEILFPVIAEKKAPEFIQKKEDIPTGTEHILFIDDEISLVKTAEASLKKLGYTITTETDPLKALDCFKAAPTRFDIVVTDMTMPNMTGEKLAEALLEIRPDIPIILCTGYSKRVSNGTLNKTGIKAFADKPVAKNDLARLVRQVLDQTISNPS